MPKGYRYYPIENFPALTSPGQIFTTSYQKSLRGVPSDDHVRSELRFLGLSENDRFTKYLVRHETILNLEVRFDNIVRPSVITIQEFPLFLAIDGIYLWIATNERLAEELFERIRRTEMEFRHHRREIRLPEMRRDLQGQVTGGWFKNLRIARVRTAAIFGEGVTESEDWLKYETHGVTSALIVEANTDFGPLSFEVTRTGSIVLFQNLAERLSLEVLEDLNEVVGRFATPTQD